MEKNQKMFSLGQMLSITDGHLMCQIDGVYEILNYLTDDDLYTHQLPRAAEVCKPYILQVYPQLAQFDGSGINAANYRERLESAEAKFGEFLPLSPLPSGVHLHIDPVEELGAMVGDDNVIVLREDAP